MLEVIALYFLSKRIGLLAEQKGENPTRWKWYTIFTWIGAEIVGVLVGMLIWGQNMYMLELAGVGFAIAGYFTLREALLKKDDVQPTDLDFDGDK